jgi:hypothetical protein
MTLPYIFCSNHYDESILLLTPPWSDWLWNVVLQTLQISTMDDLPRIAQSQIDLLVENLNVQYKDLSQADKLQKAIDLVIKALRNGDRVD